MVEQREGFEKICWIAFRNLPISNWEKTDVLGNKTWLSDLAFLTDITGHLNTLNQHLQGTDHFIFDIFQELQAFQLKLQLFQWHLQSGNLIHFETCQLFQREYQCDFSGYRESCETLQKEFNNRFQSFNGKKELCNFMRDPFSCMVEAIPDEYQLEVIVQLNEKWHLRKITLKHFSIIFVQTNMAKLRTWLYSS